MGGLKPLPGGLRDTDGTAAPRQAWVVEPFNEGEAADYARLRELLTGAGYTEPALCARFGIPSIGAFRQLREGRADDAPIDGPLPLLVRLFLDAEAVECDVLRFVVGDAGVSVLERLGLLHEPAAEPGSWRATVLLYPTQGLWLVSDANVDPEDDALPPPADVVYPAIAEGTQRFVTLMPRDPCGDFVELCSGTGIAALVAARDFARHAWAIDLTDRATRFARFNAALNGITNFTALQGDLWAPLEGRVVDRVVAHPPYMPSFETLYVFRDGGEDGEQVTRRIFAGLADHLRAGGDCFCVCMATDRAEAPLERRVRAMLGERAEEFDVLIAAERTHDPLTYYAAQAREGGLAWEVVGRRQDAFARMGITQLVFGALYVRRGGDAGDAGPLTERRRLGATTPGDFAWALDRAARERLDLLRQAPERLRPRTAERVQVRVEREHADGRWTDRECEIAASIPFAMHVRGPAWFAELLARCDGATDARALLAGLEADLLVPADADPAEFASIVLRLVECGVLELPEWPFPARQGAAV